MIHSRLTKIDDEEYFGIQGMVNASTLKALYRKSPKHYQASLDFPEPEPRVFVLGSAIHCICLETEEFENRYITMPEFEPTEIDKKTGEVKEKTSGWKNTKDYKQQKVAWCSKHKDKVILELEEDMLCRKIYSAYVASPYYEMCSGGAAEITILSTARGVQAKGKFDLLIDLGNEVLIVDLKTTSDASEEGFLKSVFNYDYDLAAAWYKEMLLTIPDYEGKEIRFMWLAAEKKPPYSMCMYEASDEVLMNGRAKCSKALTSYKQWQALGAEVGYKAEDEVVVLKVPNWGRA